MMTPLSSVLVPLCVLDIFLQINSSSAQNMLDITWMVTVSVPKKFGNLNFSAVAREKVHKQVVYQSMGEAPHFRPPVPDQTPKQGEKLINAA